MSILFLAKEKPFAEDAADLIKKHFKSFEIIFGDRDEPFPDQVLGQGFDYVISYMSPWVVPEEVLEKTKVAAVNFHPGSPKYPGIGCTNFAIYNQEKEYGITVHHMKEKVDTGDIIAVETFPIFAKDSVYTLTQRCYAYIYMAFIKIFPLMLSGQALPKSKDSWTRVPYTRHELNELCRLTQDMPKEEINRRIRATQYPGMPGAYWEIGGKKIEAKYND